MISCLTARPPQHPHPNEIDAPGFEETMRYVEWLMRWYCRKPSLLIANIIVSRLEWLGSNDAAYSAQHHEWACTRLLEKWRYLAARCRAENNIR